MISYRNLGHHVNNKPITYTYILLILNNYLVIKIDFNNNSRNNDTFVTKNQKMKQSNDLFLCFNFIVITIEFPKQVLVWL